MPYSAVSCISVVRIWISSGRPSGPITVVWRDRKSTRLNSSHTDISPLSLHDALPILDPVRRDAVLGGLVHLGRADLDLEWPPLGPDHGCVERSEEHTSELQSHRYLPSFPTRRSSDLRSSAPRCRTRRSRASRSCGSGSRVAAPRARSRLCG